MFKLSSLKIILNINGSFFYIIFCFEKSLNKATPSGNSRNPVLQSSSSLICSGRFVSSVLLRQPDRCSWLSVVLHTVRCLSAPYLSSPICLKRRAWRHDQTCHCCWTEAISTPHSPSTNIFSPSLPPSKYIYSTTNPLKVYWATELTPGSSQSFSCLSFFWVFNSSPIKVRLALRLKRITNVFISPLFSVLLALCVAENRQEDKVKCYLLAVNSHWRLL